MQSKNMKVCRFFNAMKPTQKCPMMQQRISWRRSHAFYKSLIFFWICTTPQICAYSALHDKIIVPHSSILHKHITSSCLHNIAWRNYSLMNVHSRMHFISQWCFPKLITKSSSCYNQELWNHYVTHLSTFYNTSQLHIIQHHISSWAQLHAFYNSLIFSQIY
jgi:hypothetical protein